MSTDKSPILIPIGGTKIKVTAGTYYINGKKYTCKEQILDLSEKK